MNSLKSTRGVFEVPAGRVRPVRPVLSLSARVCGAGIGLLLFCLLAGFSLFGAEPLFLVHYMPWYATRDVSGQWGWHWTMNHYKPDHIFSEGRREAASHDYPLIGLYDSGDDQALECQVLLMKFAGMNGVIIDWYGTRTTNDYPILHRNTEKLVPWLKKAGLRFAVCYEDQILKQLKPDEAMQQGLADLQWAEKNWFGEDSYLRQGGRPLLLVFGPQFIKKDQWDQVRASLSSKPIIYGLPHLSKETGVDGAFGWPPVTGGKNIPEEKWRKDMESLYARRAAGESIMAAVFPGFKDIYREAGVHDSYGQIDSGRGKTLSATWEMAVKSGASMLQIATWNDYGEGTVIEPTRNQGYRYLDFVQKQTKAAQVYHAADLRLPVQLYQLRKRCAGDTSLSNEINQAAAMLFASRCSEAESLMVKIGAKLGQRPAVFLDEPSTSDDNYRMVTDVIYREGSGVTDAMKARCRLDVYTPATNRSFATLVWFHGGGITEGVRSIPLPLRKQGIAVVSASYRLLPEAKTPEFIEDAAAAVAWTFRHIGEYGGSTNRIFVSGHSAGGYLTAMVGLDKRWLAVYGIDANRIAGLIPLSPQAITHFAIRGERGISDKQPIVDDLAPMFHVRKDAPPLFILTGDREKELLGRYEENAYFWRMMKIAGHKDLELKELPGYNHGSMPEPAYPLLLEFMAKRSPDGKLQ